MEYLSDRLTQPEDFYEIFPWHTLSPRSQNTLRRAIERSVASESFEQFGFTYDLLSKISLEDLKDARNVGPARAEELIQELVALFATLNLANEPDTSQGAPLPILYLSTPRILTKLMVDLNFEEYLRRVDSIELLTPRQRSPLLQDLFQSRSTLKRRLFGRRNQESALGRIVDANLRLSFVVAKRLYLDRDIRARVLAGNLGLLAGIGSFSDEDPLNFDGHLMKYIRCFIQDLIGSYNFSYEDIVELMTRVVQDDTNATDDDEFTVHTLPFVNCTTFSELFEELDRELRKLPKVDERSISMLKHRHLAFREPGLTLDDLGKEWGVTRERVRQIVNPLMKVRIPIVNEIPIVAEAVALYEQSESDDHFSAIVAAEELFSGEEVTWDRLWGIADILSLDSLANRIYEKHQSLELNSETFASVRGSIKKERSKFGLYDLEVVAKKYAIDEDSAFRFISEVYPRSIRHGNLVLARTKSLDTMFENSIVKQLKVASPLEAKDLLRGLHRTGKLRSASLMGSTTDLTKLIFDLAGDPPNYAKASNGLIKEIEFQTIEKWFVQIFSETSLGILHSNDVVNLALRHGRINVSSAMVNLLNSPIVRSQGRSLYSLVGTDVTEDQLDAYIQIVRGTKEASEVSCEMVDTSTAILSVKPNLNVITSGIVFLPSIYQEIFQGYEFWCSCVCSDLHTIQSVKFTPSGFWTGFTAMIRHGFSHHQMLKGSTFRFEFNFDKLLVTLLVT